MPCRHAIPGQNEAARPWPACCGCASCGDSGSPNGGVDGEVVGQALTLSGSTQDGRGHGRPSSAGDRVVGPRRRSARASSWASSSSQADERTPRSSRGGETSLRSCTAGDRLRSPRSRTREARWRSRRRRAPGRTAVASACVALEEVQGQGGAQSAGGVGPGDGGVGVDADPPSKGLFDPVVPAAQADQVRRHGSGPSGQGVTWSRSQNRALTGAAGEPASAVAGLDQVDERRGGR